VSELRIVDVSEETTFRGIPPCADPRFDHRTCDYWEDAERGSKASRPAWLDAPATQKPSRPALEDNPFAPPPAEPVDNPFARVTIAAALDPLGGDDLFATPAYNPFAPEETRERPRTSGVPRKLALLDRGRGVFGSYAKVLLEDEQPSAYAQFGPLSAYPRAMRLRDLYPVLPQSPLPAVITCIATAASARGRGHGRRLVEDVCRDLADRGFSAVEAYPDLTLPVDETSAARPAFWMACGFSVVVDDARFPVMRRELD
jgi:GNAT superfamily N-acetyltransferase